MTPLITSSLALGKVIGELIPKFNIWLQVIEQTAKAMKYLIDTSSKFQNAKLGLESVSLSKGYDPVIVQKMVKDLNSVRGGLMSVGEASIAMKNLLASNFTLEESATMLNKIGDAAAFGRVESLSFSEAVISATEGIKTGNPELLKNAGLISDITNNQQILSNVSTNSATKLTFFNDVIAQTSTRLGDTNKLIESSEGAFGRFDNATEKTSIWIGTTLSNALNASLDVLTDTINLFNDAPPIVKNFLVPLGGLSFIFSEATDDTAKFKERLHDLNSEINSSNEGIEKLQYLYEILSSNTVLSKEAQEEYNKILNEVAVLYPQILTGVNSLTGEYQTNAETLKGIIEHERELNRLRNEKLAFELAKEINKTVGELDKWVARNEQLKQKNEELKDSIETLSGQLHEAEKELKALTDAGAKGTPKFMSVNARVVSLKNELSKLEDELKKNGNEFIKLSPKILNAQLNINEFITTALKTGNINTLFDFLTTSINNSASATEFLKQAFANMSSGAIASLVGITNNTKGFAEILKSIGVGLKLISEGKLQEGINQIHKAIEIGLSAGINPSQAPPKGNNNTYNKGKKQDYSDDSEEEHEKTLDDIIDSLETRIELFSKGNTTRGISLEKARDEIRKIHEEMDPQQISDEQELRYIKFDRELTFGIISELLDSIKLASEEQRERLLNKEIPRNEYNPYPTPNLDKQKVEQDNFGFFDEAGLRTILAINDALENSVSVISNFFHALASGDSKAFKNFLKGIVNTFLTSIQAMLVGAEGASAAKGITTFGLSLITDLPLLAAGFLALEAAKALIANFNKGGFVPGSGNTDTIPAMLTPGEFVIRKPAVEWLNNTFGGKIFDFLNASTNPLYGFTNSVPAYFASGGMVHPYSPAMPLHMLGGGGAQTVKVELGKAVITHRDIRASLIQSNKILNKSLL